MHPIVRGAIALLFVSGCSSPQSDIEGPVATVVSPSISPVDASAEPQSILTVPPTTTEPRPTNAPAATSEIEARFLPIDVRCEKDADCAVTKRGVGVPLFCCDACDAVAGGRAWVARADLRCSAYAKEPVQHSCPPRDCAAPRGARCNHGACELLP